MTRVIGTCPCGGRVTYTAVDGTIGERLCTDCGRTSGPVFEEAEARRLEAEARWLARREQRRAQR